MHKIAKFIIIPSILLLLITSAGIGDVKGPGTTGANFLKIGVGARACAMGGAFTALADDATALYWNPAGLAQIKRAELYATYNSWFQGINQGYVGLTFPFIGGKLALGANYVDMGKLEGRDNEGGLTGEFGATDIQANLGYAVGNKFMIGFSAGAVQETLGGNTQTAFLGTAGILLKPDPHLSIGVSYQNLGENSGQTSLPQTLRGGVALKIGSIILSFDAVMPNDNDSYFCGGVEFPLGNFIALRGGYTTRNDAGQGYSAGVGINISGLSVDYAYVPYSDLGDTHRISLTMRW